MTCCTNNSQYVYQMKGLEKKTDCGAGPVRGSKAGLFFIGAQGGPGRALEGPQGGDSGWPQWGSIERKKH
jgi:hypothetical protein